jgi:hypothetical protein
VQDIESPDLGHRGGTDRDLGSAGGTDRFERDQSFLGRELFRIVDQYGEPARDSSREHHGRGKHRAGQRATPDLIDPGDTSAGLLFQPERRHPGAIADRDPSLPARRYSFGIAPRDRCG